MKKILIVGNGRSVLQKKQGALIDKFENVARINRYRIKKYEEFVGTKTNFVSFNLPVFNQFIKTDQELITEYKKENKGNLKFLFELYKQQKTDLKSLKKNLQIFKHNTLYLPERTFEKDTTFLLFFEKEKFLTLTEPACYKSVANPLNFSTGFGTIKYFVEQNFEVTITGFDFFQKSSCYWLKNSDVFTEKKLIIDRTENFKDGHDYVSEEILLKRYIISKQVKIL